MQKRAQPRHLAVSTGSMCVCVCLGAGGLGGGGAHGEEASEEEKRLWSPGDQESRRACFRGHRHRGKVKQEPADLVTQELP